MAHEDLDMDGKIRVTMESLKSRGFIARYAEDRQAAREMIVDMAQENWIVGNGDSATVRSIGVLHDLQDRGHYVLNPFIWVKIMRENPKRLPLRVMKLTSQGCDMFLSSSNAVTLNGRLVNVDGGGMRVTGQVFGPLLSVFVVGRNKIVRDLDEAFYRIKNIIAPVHTRTCRKERPAEDYLPIDPAKCITELKDIDPERYAGPERLAGGNIVVILEGKPMGTEIEIAVIIVNEDLGLGWDPDWPQERKDKIFLEYQRFTPPHRPIRD